MTRTTDIAHFYKVTTEPDPEWGSGLSAPELGKLLEGAYITSTDKTISFVVGGVGKTKCKTAWEFDAQGRMVNASTKDIKYDKFRSKDDLLILPGACPEAMGPKGLEGNIGWSDPGDVYRFVLGAPIEAAELDEGVEPPRGMSGLVAATASLWRLEIGIDGAVWTCVDPRIELDALQDDDMHKAAFQKWGAPTLTPRGELTTYQKQLMRSAIRGEDRLTDVFLKVVADGWGYRVLEPPMPNLIYFANLLDVFRGFAEAAKVGSLNPEKIGSIFTLLLPRVEGTPFPLTDYWVEILTKLAAVFPISKEIAAREDYKQIRAELVRRLILPPAHSEYINSRQYGSMLMQAVIEMRGDVDPKIPKAVSAVNGMLSGSTAALKQMIHPDGGDNSMLTPNKTIAPKPDPPAIKAKSNPVLAPGGQPASPAGMLKPIGTGEEAEKQHAGTCVAALALTSESTQDEVLGALFADTDMSKFMFQQAGYQEWVAVPWLDQKSLTCMRANVIAKLYKMAKVTPDPTSPPPDEATRKGILMSILMKASELGEGPGGSAGNKKTSRSLRDDYEDEEEEKHKGRGVAGARSDEDKQFAMHAYVANAITSIEVESAVNNSEFDGLDGVHALKAFGMHTLFGSIFGKYVASNGKIKDTGVVPFGRSIPPKLVAGRQEFVDVLVSLLQGPDEVAVNLDTRKVKKLAEAMLKMQFSLTDIVDTMGCNGNAAAHQTSWSKMQAAMVRAKPAMRLVLSFYSSLESPVWVEDESFMYLCTHVTDFAVTNDIPPQTMHKFVDTNIFGLLKLKAERWRAGDELQPRPPNLKEIIDSTKSDLLEKARDARLEARYPKPKRAASASSSSDAVGPRKKKLKPAAKAAGAGGGGTAAAPRGAARAGAVSASAPASQPARGTGGDKLRSIVQGGQEFLCQKFPASAGTKSPCFAVAWGKSRCNFPPCKDKNEHDPALFPPKVGEVLKGYLRDKSLPASFADWSAQNPKP